MRYAMTLLAVLVLAVTASAQDLAAQAPLKVPGIYPENVPNPVRQGGDTIATATVIPHLPYNDSGTTAGYVDDYAGTCLFDNGAPDVVYRLVAPAGNYGLHVSLCGSTYDTGLYVLNSSLVEVACNDDYCGLQSQLDHLWVTPGETYYIIVDGYSSASGSYVLYCEPYINCCALSCPNDGVPEDEPPLVDEYVDNFNGGCNTPGQPFQVVSGDPAGNLVICGESGWYLNSGSNFRDTDWRILMKADADAPIEITADAEYATYLFELSPQDCGSVAVAQQTTVGPCIEGEMTIGGPAGPAWFWIGPTVFASPDGSRTYDYVLWLSGLEPAVAAESITWSTLKSLFE
jgi:hypothetical protein